MNDFNFQKQAVERIINDQYLPSEKSEDEKTGDFLRENNCVVKKNLFKEPVLRYPWKKDGIINWKNLIIGGSWGKFIGMIVFCAFLLFASWAYHQDTDYYKSVIGCYKNPPNIKNFTAYETCEKLKIDYDIRTGIRDAYGNVINEQGMKKNY